MMVFCSAAFLPARTVASFQLRWVSELVYYMTNAKRAGSPAVPQTSGRRPAAPWAGVGSMHRTKFLAGAGVVAQERFQVESAGLKVRLFLAKRHSHCFKGRTPLTIFIRKLSSLAVFATVASASNAATLQAIFI
jgi:hypothetical protein